MEYLLQRVLPTGDTLLVAPSGLLPLIRRPLSTAANATDSANFSRPDSVRAVRLNFRVTNGLAGTEERIREITTVVEVPNNGIAMPNICGRPPLAPGAFTVTEVGSGLGQALLSWTRSPDQDAGEVDARQYVIWRRPAAAAAWDAPLLFIRAERDTVNYSTQINDNEPGTAYIFGVATQDCTPSFSSISTASITLAVP
jgi:hypothetical protein